MRVCGFKFNLRKLAGLMGDFGTLFPLAIGYFVVNGLNPAGLLVMTNGVRINPAELTKQRRSCSR